MFRVFIALNWITFEGLKIIRVSTGSEEDSTTVRYRQNLRGLYPLVDLYLNFEKSIWTTQVWRTGFLACKNQFQNWFLQTKNPVCQIGVFQLDFSKFKYRSTGGGVEMSSNLLKDSKICLSKPIWVSFLIFSKAYKPWTKSRKIQNRYVFQLGPW